MIYALKYFGLNLVIKTYFIRLDSFLHSNTATANNRSRQTSHMSIESLSQMYNQNMRLKFGSAPAQLLHEGKPAARSLDKRVSEIKAQFSMENVVGNTANNNKPGSGAGAGVPQHRRRRVVPVSTDDELIDVHAAGHNFSKQAVQGTNSSTSWANSRTINTSMARATRATTREDKPSEADESVLVTTQRGNKPSNNTTMRFSLDEDDSSDDDDRRFNGLSNRSPTMSHDSGRSSNSGHSIGF